MVVELFVTLGFLVVLLVVGGFGIATYRADPVGWKATVKRISNVIRANLEAGKAPKAVETKSMRQQLEQDWDNRFHGKPTAIAPVKPKVFEHKIVEKWYAVYGGSESPFWKCSCGYQDWHVDKMMANMGARRHVKDSNAAEKAKASGSKLQW